MIRVTIEHGLVGAKAAVERADAIAIIDVLRASTTYAAMLSAGAERIVPFESIEKLEQVAREFPSAIKSGERECKKIVGFDIGSSPSSIIETDLTGKVILSSTTNGSKMAAATSSAPLLIMAGFCNISSACKKLVDSGLDVSLVCSGRLGKTVPEDSLCAMIMSSILHENKEIHPNQEEVEEISKRSNSYKTLKEAGLGADFAICMHSDLFEVAPTFDGTGFVSS